MVELSNKRYRSVQLSFIALELRFFWFHWSCTFFGFIALELRFHFIIILLVYSAYLMAQEHFNGGWVAPESKPPLAG